MNIAKNHWVTFKCTVIDISLHLLVPVTFSFGTYFTAVVTQIYLRWTISKHSTPARLQEKHWKLYKSYWNHLGGPNFHWLIPLTFESSTGHHWPSWPKPPIQLRSRWSWGPAHKNTGGLDHSNRPKLPIYYTLSTSAGWRCQLIPLTFEPSRTKLKIFTTTRPPKLQIRYSWDPVHKTAWWLSDLERSYSWFTTPLPRIQLRTDNFGQKLENSLRNSPATGQM